MKLIRVTSFHNRRTYLLDLEKVLTIGSTTNTGENGRHGTEFTFLGSHPQQVSETYTEVVGLIAEAGLVIYSKEQ